MINANDIAIQNLLHDWHEAGRKYFQEQFENLDYDSQCYTKTVKERRKYLCLDDGTSGAFMVDRQTGEVFNIKGYGVPNKKKMIGYIQNLTGLDLYSRRW